jgi:hypothetical protein
MESSLIFQPLDLSWNNLKDFYNHDENKINNLINEFIKLNEYLTSECKLFEELENSLYFSSEQKIIDFINNDLKVS